MGADFDVIVCVSSNRTLRVYVPFHAVIVIKIECKKEIHIENKLGSPVVYFYQMIKNVLFID